MFILKKLISRLFFPLPLVMALLIVGACLTRGRRKMMLTGIAVLYLFSFAPFSYLMLHPLESRYAPVVTSALDKEVRWIVVLGAGSRSDKALTPEDRLTDAGLKRLMEGLRLARLLPQTRLVLSGGDYRGESPDALVMNQVLFNHGFDQKRVVLELASLDTHDQACYLKDQLGQAPFYLVTSASHMPRAIKLFQHLGTRPIAAPTDFRAVWEPLRLNDFFPQAGALAVTEGAFYEYLGLMWCLLRGYI